MNGCASESLLTPVQLVTITSVTAEIPQRPMPCALTGSPAPRLTYRAQRVGQQLWEQIPKYEYPPLALQHGWEGTVLACFRVAHDGRILYVDVVRGSGNIYLDAEALQLIRSLHRFTIDPPLDQPWFIAQVLIKYTLPVWGFERTVGLNAWQQLLKTARRSVSVLAADLKGSAVWRVRLDTNGHINAMELDLSSGINQIDEAAKNIIIESAPFPVHSVDPNKPSVLILPVGFNLHIR